MTFLIVAEDLPTGAELAERIREREPDSFCISISPSTAEEALNTIQVDCVICPPELAECLSRRKLPWLAVWPPEVSAEPLAKTLLPHRV